MTNEKPVKKLCVSMRACAVCPICKAAQAYVLDCGQYVAQYPVRAEWLARNWLEGAKNR